MTKASDVSVSDESVMAYQTKPDDDKKSAPRYYYYYSKRGK